MGFFNIVFRWGFFITNVQILGWFKLIYQNLLKLHSKAVVWYYTPKKPKNSQILFKSQTKNSQASDLQKKADFFNLALKKPILQPCWSGSIGADRPPGVSPACRVQPTEVHGGKRVINVPDLIDSMPDNFGNSQRTFKFVKFNRNVAKFTISYEKSLILGCIIYNITFFAPFYGG